MRPDSTSPGGNSYALKPTGWVLFTAILAQVHGRPPAKNNEPASTHDAAPSTPAIRSGTGERHYIIPPFQYANRRLYISLNIMRSVRYIVTPMHVEGTKVVYLESSERETSLAKLIFGELGNLWFGLVPPMEVLNRELANGGAVVAGPVPNERQHNYNWLPFEVTADDYRELVEAADKLPGRPFEYVEPPKKLRLPEEWSHWALVRSMEKTRKRFHDGT
jgi:hypothetical protein